MILEGVWLAYSVTASGSIKLEAYDRQEDAVKAALRPGWIFHPFWTKITMHETTPQKPAPVLCNEGLIAGAPGTHNW